MLCSRLAERRFVARQIKPQAGEKATQTHETGYIAYTCVMARLFLNQLIIKYMNKLVFKHCQACGEVTPQADNNTTGHTCQVCLSNSFYDSDSVVFEATSEKLAEFWKRKYYDLKNHSIAVVGNCSGQISVTVQNSSTVPFLLNEP